MDPPPLVQTRHWITAKGWDVKSLCASRLLDKRETKGRAQVADGCVTSVLTGQYSQA